MTRKVLIVVLLFDLIAISPAAGQTKDNDKVEKSRLTATKFASDGKDLAEVRLKSGEKLKGRISSVQTDSFSFTDEKSGKSQTIVFSDVDQIKKSRKGLSTGAWIAIGAAAAAAIILTVLFRSYYCNEQAC